METITGLYKKSLDSIKPGQFINMRAIINEIISEFWFSKNEETIGIAYIREAYYFYDQWGAFAKISLLDNKYSNIFKPLKDEKILSIRHSSSRSSVADLDLKSILKASQSGTGLGMHIIFKLVTQTLKGTITCESALNKGSEFVIDFKPDKE